MHARRNMTAAGYVALGAGLALVAGAATLYGVGGARGARAHGDYMDATNPNVMAHHYADVERARTMVIAGHGLAGAGVIALGISLYQFLARPDAPQDQPRMAVGPVAGGAALSVGGTF